MLMTNHWNTTTGMLKENIIHAVGTLQTCAGQESGIEAAIHAVRKSFKRTTMNACC